VGKGIESDDVEATRNTFLDCINSTTSAAGIDIAGGFITRGPGNPLQCCQQCYSMPNCVAYTYYTQNPTYCWFWPRTTTKNNAPITTVFLYGK
jgi:hypothetical protein